MCEPLYLGSFLLGVLPLLFEGACERPARRRRYAVLAAGAGLLLVWSWSRGAWLGAAAGGMAGLVLWWRADRTGERRLPPARRSRALIVAGVIVTGLILLLAIAPQALLLPARRLAQSFSREDWSNLTRLYSMQAGWRAFWLSPLVGVGWGQFAFHFPALVDPRGLQSQFAWPVVNCYPLEILCETGALGFAVFVAALAIAARAVWRACDPRAPEGSHLGPAGRRRVAAAAAAAVAVWSQLLTFSQYNLPHLWVTVGLLFAALAPVEQRATGAAAEGEKLA
jgi:O-antigen ligase